MQPQSLYNTLWAGLLLGTSLFSCQPAVEPALTTTPARISNTADYLFEGNPGIPTSSVYDVSGQLTGTVGGINLTFGTDNRPLLESSAGVFSPGKPQTGSLWIEGRYMGNAISLSLRGPLRVGSYKWVETGYDFDDPLTAIGFLSRYPWTPAVYTSNLFLLSKPDRSVRLTNITPEIIEGEFVFTLNKPGATEERLTFRVKNQSAENSTLRSTSLTDPFWDYSGVYRSMDAVSLFNPSDSTSALTGLKWKIWHTPTQSTSDILVDGITYPATWQFASIEIDHKRKGPYPLEIVLRSGPRNGDWPTRKVSFRLADFKGVGTYEGTALTATLSVALSQTDWVGSATQNRLASTQTRVVITRVTPDVIEGTYTLQNLPVRQRVGNQATELSASGTFKVIYPR